MFLLVLGIFLLIVNLLIEKFKVGRILNFIITYVIIIGTVGFLEYTPDRQYYTYWMYLLPNDKEPFFLLVAAFLNKNNLGYPELHIIFTFTYTFLLLFLISKFSSKIFIISLLYIATIFIFYATQLRYFMGYYAVCLGLYYLYVKRNYPLSIIFFIFGFANHYGLFLFGAMVPFFYIKPKNILSRIVITTLVILLLTILLATAGLSNLRFIAYFDTEYQTSFLGGALTFLPYVLFVFLIYRLNLKVIKKNPEIISDKKYIFLFVMSMANIIFIGVALITQVIGHRMIMPATLFQILYVIYVSKYYKGLAKLKLLIYLGLALLFLYFYLYVFVELVAGGSDDDILRIFQSSKVLDYFIF